MGDQIVNGIVIGCGYGLIAMGWAFVFGILGLPNMAHGEMVMVGAFGGWIAWGALAHLGAPLLVGVLVAAGVAIVVGATAGLVVDLAGFRLLRGGGEFQPIVSTLALSMIAISIVSSRYGSDLSPVPQEIPDFGTHVLGVPLSAVQITTVVASLLVAGLSIFGLYRTTWGSSVRAIAEHPQVARLAGIDVQSVRAQVFLVSGALAGAGAALYMFRLGAVSPFMGGDFLLKGLIVLVIGGLDRLPAILGAGILLGIIEGVATQLAGAQAELYVFVALVLLVLIRPNGLIPPRSSILVRR